MKCNRVKHDLLIACEGFKLNVSNCQHIFCEECFTNENKNNNNLTDDKLRCPCCKAKFYDYFLTIEEAIIFGEAAYLNYKFYFDQDFLYERHQQVTKKFESAVNLNPLNKTSLICLIRCLQYHSF